MRNISCLWCACTVAHRPVRACMLAGGGEVSVDSSCESVSTHAYGRKLKHIHAWMLWCVTDPMHQDCLRAGQLMRMPACLRSSVFVGVHGCMIERMPGSKPSSKREHNHRQTSGQAHAVTPTLIDVSFHLLCARIGVGTRVRTSMWVCVWGRGRGCARTCVNVQVRTLACGWQRARVWPCMETLRNCHLHACGSLSCGAQACLRACACV